MFEHFDSFITSRSKYAYNFPPMYNILTIFHQSLTSMVSTIQIKFVIKTLRFMIMINIFNVLESKPTIGEPKYHCFNYRVDVILLMVPHNFSSVMLLSKPLLF